MGLVTALATLLVIFLAQSGNSGLWAGIFKSWIASLLARPRKNTEKKVATEQKSTAVDLNTARKTDSPPPVRVMNENVDEAHTTVNFNFNCAPEEVDGKLPMVDGGEEREYNPQDDH